MDAVTGGMISSLLENSRYVNENVYTVNFEINDVYVNQGTAYTALENSEFRCDITGIAGFNLEVKVTMGGKDITHLCYNNGSIRINAVTGPICINAVSEVPKLPPEAYRWEYGNVKLNPVGESTSINSLTKLEGVMVSDFHINSRYKLSKPIILRHDRPWSLEWSSAGLGDDTMLFAGAEKTAEKYSTHRSGYHYHRHNQN